jgi:uncharacterized damage-inducible protein DinB
MSTTTLISLFGQKACTNAELLAVLAKLPPEHADAQHTAMRTLNHILVVDKLFQARLAGQPEPFAATNTPATPTLAQLQADVAATDAWYVDYAGRATPALLAEVIDFRFTDGDTGRMSREEILLHVITHGAYHRGNVGQVLKGISVPPPRDLYTKFLHLTEPARRSA